MIKPPVKHHYASSEPVSLIELKDFVGYYWKTFIQSKQYLVILISLLILKTEGATQ